MATISERLKRRPEMKTVISTQGTVDPDVTFIKLTLLIYL